MTYTTDSKPIVLDTNVCLDLFVFHDARWNPLLAALESGKIRAVTREDCRKEWQVVLTYPHLPLDDSSRQRSAEAFDKLISISAEPPHYHPARLPICTDPDDQKFLELARDANASTLITKDKALLKLAKKTERVGLFSIVTPELWVRNSQCTDIAP